MSSLGILGMVLFLELSSVGVSRLPFLVELTMGMHLRQRFELLLMLLITLGIWVFLIFGLKVILLLLCILL